ncbi:transposase-like protein [Thermus thermophilus]|nr:transposase-like protein [Thermus thermophilus]
MPGCVGLGRGSFCFWSWTRVWPLVDAVVANGRVETEEELWARVEARCAYLQTQPGLIRSHTLFHWWPGGC